MRLMWIAFLLLSIPATFFLQEHVVQARDDKGMLENTMIDESEALLIVKEHWDGLLASTENVDGYGGGRIVSWNALRSFFQESQTLQKSQDLRESILAENIIALGES